MVLPALAAALKELHRAPADSALWSLLDADDIPFRVAAGELVERLGTVPSGWTDAYRLCLLNESTLVPHLAHPLAIRVDRALDRLEPPRVLDSAVRRHDDAHANLAEVETVLRARFGPPEDVSVSNTRTLRWCIGRARIEANIFLPSPHLPTGNTRHERVPGSATECTIQVETGYRAPWTSEERQALDQARLCCSGPVSTAPTRDWPADRTPREPGLAVADGWLLVLGEHGVAPLARARLGRLHLSRLQPARGPGGAQLWVSLDGGRSVGLAARPGRPSALDAGADALALALGCPLDVTDDHDC